MPRVLDPRLREAHDRANPATELMARIVAPDVAQVLRRAADQFNTTPPLVSETPAASAVASPSGQLVLASTGLQVFNAPTVAGFWHGIGPYDKSRVLKAAGWQVASNFNGGVLRKFSAFIEFAGTPFNSYADLFLQVYRASYTPMTRVMPNGARSLWYEWAFTELLPGGGAVKAKGAIPWSGATAWVEFDVSQYALRIEPQGVTAPDPDRAGEMNVYYFALSMPQAATENSLRWRTDSTTARTVSGVGTFQRRDWNRGSENEQWKETVSADVPCCKVELEQFVASSARVYAIDLGRAPSADATGRVVFERSAPTGTSATLELSTAGTGGPWTAVAHDAAVTVKQQTYHVRLTLASDAARRQSPRVSAFGVRFDTAAIDVTAEAVIEPLEHEVSMPFCEAGIAQGKLSLLRTGVRDYADTASELAATKPDTQLEAELLVGCRHPQIGSDAWFTLDRAPVSNRAPTETGEHFTLLSYQAKLGRKIPARTESINSVHKVVSATTGQLVVTPELVGSTTPGHDYLGKGYYLRVRSSSSPDIPAGWIQPIEDNTNKTTLTFTANALPGVLSAGDLIEVHSARYTQPPLKWQDADPADVWWEILTTHLQIPPERIGFAGLGRAGRSGLPPKVTDRAPGDAATQTKCKVSNYLTDASEGDKLIDQLSFILGGVTTEIAGQIVFRQIYPLRDASGTVTVAPEPTAAVFDVRDYFNLDTPTGREERISVLACDYGVNRAAAKPDAQAASTVYYADADAVAWLTQQDLEAFGAAQIPDEIAAWCYNTADGGRFLATQLTQQVVLACSTGKRLWSWGAIDAKPELVIGDQVVVVTDKYTDYDPTTKRAIKGWGAYTLVLVSVAAGGRRFRGYMMGLAAGAARLAGGPGSLSGAGAPIPIPGDFLLDRTLAGSPDQVVAWLTARWTPPQTPFFDHMEYSVRARPTRTPAVSYSTPTTVIGTRAGGDRIFAMPGTDIEVTPITVTSGGVRFAGTPVVAVVERTPPPVPEIGNPEQATGALRYTVTDFGFAKYVRWWTQKFPADPGETNVENTGTEMPRLEVGGNSSALGQALTTGEGEAATFVGYDAAGTRSEPILRHGQKAAPTAPPNLAGRANVSRTANSITNSVTLPGGDVSLINKIAIYRNGSFIGTVDVTVLAGKTQQIIHSSLTPGTSYVWEYAARSTAGGESAKTAALTVATLAGTAPTTSPTGLSTSSGSSCEMDGFGSITGRRITEYSASWTNTNTTDPIKAEWFVDGVSQGVITLSAGASGSSVTVTDPGQPLAYCQVWYSNAFGDGPKATSPTTAPMFVECNPT